MNSGGIPDGRTSVGKVLEVGMRGRGWGPGRGLEGLWVVGKQDRQLREPLHPVQALRTLATEPREAGRARRPGAAGAAAHRLSRAGLRPAEHQAQSGDQARRGAAKLGEEAAGPAQVRWAGRRGGLGGGAAGAPEQGLSTSCAPARGVPAGGPVCALCGPVIAEAHTCQLKNKIQTPFLKVTE